MHAASSTGWRSAASPTPSPRRRTGAGSTFPAETSTAGVATAVRFHPGELLLALPARLAAVVALGVPPEGVLFFEIVFGVANLLEHVNLDSPHRFEPTVQRLFITPALHRGHHTADWQEVGRHLPPRRRRAARRDRLARRRSHAHACAGGHRLTEPLAEPLAPDAGLRRSAGWIEQLPSLRSCWRRRESSSNPFKLRLRIDDHAIWRDTRAKRRL